MGTLATSWVDMFNTNIAGNNCVRIRDIGQQVGFNVCWSDGVQVETDSPYTGTAPVQEISSQPTDMKIREEMIRRINGVQRKHGVAVCPETIIWRVTPTVSRTKNLSCKSTPMRMGFRTPDFMWTMVIPEQTSIAQPLNR